MSSRLCPLVRSLQAFLSTFPMFSFFKKKPKDTPAPQDSVATTVPDAPIQPAQTIAPEATEEIVPAAPVPAEQKRSWITRLKAGLSKTSSNLTTLFIGAKIGDELYEEL